METEENKSWNEYELGELLSYEQPTPYIVDSTDYDDNYKTPVLTAGKTFIIGHTNETEGIYKKLPVIIFDDFTTATQYVNFPFKVKSSAMKILSANTELVIPKYIYYRMQIIELDHSTHKRYWIQQYSKIKITIPCIVEQKRIVDKIDELFSDLDASMAELQIAKKRLNVYRQAVLKQAFVGKTTEAWRSRNKMTISIDENYNQIYQKRYDSGNKKTYCPDEAIELSILPNNWSWVTIGDISYGVEYGSSKKSEKIGQVPVLRMGNIQNGKFDWDDLVYSNDKTEIEKYSLYPGDVLFNRTNSPELVGKTGIYRGESKAIFAGYLIRVNQVEEIYAEYLCYYLNSFMAKKYGNKVKTDGVNQSNINGQKLCSYPFPLCSIEEQKQVVLELESRLSECEKIVTIVDEVLLQVKAMGQSILKKAFEGRLI